MKIRECRTLRWVVLLFVCVVLCGCKTAGTSIQAGQSGEGRLEFYQGVPIVYLKGTPEQRGRQHGELLGTAVGELFDGYVTAFLGGGKRGAAARQQCMVVAKQMHIPPEIQREMEAFADAAGMSYDDVLLVNTMFDIKKAMQCTTVAAFGESTADGTLLFGRNLDFPTMGLLHLYSVVFVVQPDAGRRFVSVSFPGYFGVISAMNEAGLAIAVMECFDHGMTPDAPPYAMLYRQVVEQASNVNEAVALLKAGKHSTANNLMICDSSPAACVAEMTSAQFAVREPANGRITAMNRFESPALAQRSLNFRVPVLKAFQKKDGPIALNDVKDTLLRTALPGLNLQAMIFDPAKLSIHLAIGEPPAAGKSYVELPADVLGLR